MLLGIIIGLFIGSGIGLFIAALLRAGRDDKAKPEIKTNYDRIRNVSVEEMAEIIMCPYDGGICPKCIEKMNCYHCKINWLKSEVDE